MNGVLIIGCGNTDRGDDAAGLLVARRLRELGLETYERSGEALELIETWKEAGTVILVDAVVTGAPIGEIIVWDAKVAPVERDFLKCSTHAFGVAEALELARLLDCLPPQLLIYGIEGKQFVPGTQASTAVIQAVEQVAQQIVLRSQGCEERSQTAAQSPLRE